MHPLQFRPIVKRIRWGGRRLGTALGKPIGDGADYAESWELADCGDDQSTVVEGPFLGWTLSRLVAEQGAAILGRHAGGTSFPLLIKFLDAADRLSVQVHPNDEQARRLRVGDCGKTEAWVIIDADLQSRIYAGLKSGVDRPTLMHCLETGEVETCLNSFVVRPGDCVFVPAGTVHAIGEGILMAEIQQSSNVTFRLFDWGRVGPDGNPRPLHVAESMECIDFHRGPVDPVVPQAVVEPHGRVEELVDCKYFVLRRHHLAGRLALPDDRRFRVIMLLSGNVEVAADGYQRRLGVGSTLLIPAAASGVTITPAGGAILLETFLP